MLVGCRFYWESCNCTSTPTPSVTPSASMAMSFPAALLAMVEISAPMMSSSGLSMTMRTNERTMSETPRTCDLIR